MKQTKLLFGARLILRNLTAAALVAVFLSPIPSFADFMSSSMLEGLCTSDTANKTERDATRMFCTMWFSGVVDMEETNRAMIANGSFTRPLCCLPGNMTPNIARRIWLEHDNDNPTDLTKPAINNYVQAIFNAYPCG